MPGTDGFVMVPNSLVKSNLSKWAKLIWLMLKYHTDQNGGCHPSVATLAKLADISPRQVRYALKELKEAGLVTAKSRSGCCSVYTLPGMQHMPTPAYGAGEVCTPCRGGLHTVQAPTLFTDSNEQDPINKTQEQDLCGQKPKKAKKAKTEDYKDERFNEFWKAYPRKQKKPRAFKAWQKLHVNGEFSEIMAAVERFKKTHDWIKEGGTYIPHPASWLNDRRWEDELPMSPSDLVEKGQAEVEAIKQRDAQVEKERANGH